MKRISRVFFVWMSFTLPMVGRPQSIVSFVNPFIGTKPGAPAYLINNSNGNVFPGAVWPHGMVQFSPDTPDGNAGGYLYTAHAIKGFSLTHFSGRGIACWMDLPILPTLELKPGMDRKPVRFSHTDEAAAPGYYRVKLENGITVELTSTARTGLARFTFPSGSTPVLQVDTQGDSSSSKGGVLQAVSNDALSGEVTGHGGGGRGVTYKLYFYAQLDHPFIRQEIWAKSLGANLSFDFPTNGSILLKVGLSFVSLEGARANLVSENPGWDFDLVRQQASAAWDGCLSRIKVIGGTTDQKSVFYTGLYHSFIHPNLFSDTDGKYLGFDGKVHQGEKGRDQYENFSAWDNHRSLMPLLSVITPQKTSDMVQSLVNMAEQDRSVNPKGGGLPRWQQANGNSGGMEGDDQDVVIATAYALGARDFDTEKALAAMDRGASVEGTTSGGCLVRPHLSEWEKQGWMALEGSLNLEYANDDYAIAQFAQALGHSDLAQVYLKRSENWKNIFNPGWGNGGYFVPRTWFGNSIHWFPIHCGIICGFDESNSDQYTWLLPFTYPELIQKMGGQAVALNRLNAHFYDEKGNLRLNEGPDSRYAFLGNEPESISPYAYLFAEESNKAFEVLQGMASQWYRNSPDGLPGNDDGGAMGSWLVWAMAGLRPLGSGTQQVALTGPMFDSVTLDLAKGETLTIRAVRSSPGAKVLNRITLNDVDLSGRIILWEDLSHGGNLEFHYR